MKIIKKIISRIKSLVKEFKFCSQFSVYYANLVFWANIFGTLRINSLSKKLVLKKHNWILAYLKNDLSETIQKYKEDSNMGTFETNSPIWVCWWTGENNAPKLVKKCLESIRRNAGNHPVNFIDKTTYSKYITIPKYILNKVEDKSMVLANFSDYLRVSLLEKYGGLWLDATIFVSKEISDDFFNIPFFTCKSQERECTYVSKMRWTSFVIGGWKNNIILKFIKSLLEDYWLNNDFSIDYLLIDYIIETVNTENSAARKLIENVPINNTSRDDLQAAMNANLPFYKFPDIITSDTTLYKLSWRESYNTETTSNEKSIYSYFIDSNIEELMINH